MSARPLTPEMLRDLAPEPKRATRRPCAPRPIPPPANEYGRLAEAMDRVRRDAVRVYTMREAALALSPEGRVSSRQVAQWCASLGLRVVPSGTTSLISHTQLLALQARFEELADLTDTGTRSRTR